MANKQLTDVFFKVANALSPPVREVRLERAATASADMDERKIVIPVGTVSNATAAYALWKAQLLHECGHLEYSPSLTVWVNGLNQIAADLCLVGAGDMLRKLGNIIEDGRMERVVAYKLPGSGRYFRFMNSRMFKQAEGKMDTWTKTDSLLAYCKCGRITGPGAALVHKHQEVLDKALKALSGVAVIDAVRVIAKDYYREKQRKPAVIKESDNSILGSGRNRKASGTTDMYVDAGEGSKDKSSGGGADSTSCDTVDANMAELVAAEMRDAGLSREAVEDLVACADDLGSSESCIDGVRVTIASETKRAVPVRQLISRANVLRSRLSALLVNAVDRPQSLSIVGKLDTGRLFAVSTGDRVMVHKGEYNAYSVAVQIVLDASGSMAIGKITQAREAAFVVSQALQQAGLAVSIMAFDDERSTSCRHIIFKEFEEEVCDRVLTAKAGLQNVDGIAIKNATNRLMQRPETKKVLIMISDGLPRAPGYSGSFAVEHTAQMVKAAKKKGVIVAAVGVEHPDYSSHKQIYSGCPSVATGTTDVDYGIASKLPLLIERIVREVNKQ